MPDRELAVVSARGGDVLREPYLLDGNPVPSVTEVLEMYGAGQENLMVWSNNLGKKGKDYREELDRMALIGTCVHAQIEEEMSGSFGEAFAQFPKPIWDAGEKAMQAFRTWCEGKNINVINHEKRLVSRDFQCGGTYDLTCQIDDGPVILVDFKTSSAIRAKNIAQVAAYVDMVNEVEDRMIDTACILRFGRDGTSEELWVDGEMLDRGRSMFLLARQMYALNDELVLDAKSATHLINRVVNTPKVWMMGQLTVGTA